MGKLLPVALALPALAAAPAAAAAPPYPASDLGITWDTSTYRSAGRGGDIWPVTTGADGQMHTAWGDGRIGCPATVSYGTATIAAGRGGDPLRTDGCGPRGPRHGKLISLLSAGRALYAVAYLQDRPDPHSSIAVWRSTDDGRTWRKPGWAFPGATGALQPLNFVQFGRGNRGAPGGEAYLTAQKASGAPKAAYLVRAPVSDLQDKAAYQYFAGGTAWSRNPAAAEPIFADRHGVSGPEVGYDAGLRRFLLTAAHGPDHSNGGRIGVFDAPALTGPWRTVDYQNRWLGIRGGGYLGLRFPVGLMRDGGSSLGAVFSCHDHGTCGRYDDRFNLMRATLAPRGRPRPDGGAGTDAPGRADGSRAGRAPRPDGGAQLRGLELARRLQGQRERDVAAGLAALPAGAGPGLTAFPVGAPSAPGPEAASDPARAQFDRAHAPEGQDGGLGLAYQLPGGTRLAVALTRYGDGSAGPASQAGVSASLRQRLGAFELDTSLAYGRDRQEVADPGGRRSLAGRTASAAQRVGLPLRAGGGLAVTPWVGLAYVSQAADGPALQDPLAGGRRHDEAAVGDTLASLGLEGALAPVRLGEGAWLRLRSGVSYTRGLASDDYRVRGAGPGETVARPAVRAVGLTLDGSLALGGALAVDAGLALEEDLSAGSAGTGRVALSWRF